MKKIRSLLVLLVIAVMLTALAGCGGAGSGSGIKIGEEFTLGEYTIRYDSAETSGGELKVTVSLKGASGVPVNITNGSFTLLINMKAGSGADEVNATRISVTGSEEENGYGAVIEYGFEVPEGKEFDTATIYLGENESKSAVLSLGSGMSGGSGGASIAVIIGIAALAIAGILFAVQKKKKAPAGSTPEAAGGDAQTAEAASAAPAEVEAPATEAAEKTYTESDNMGTRHDSMSQAMAYWMGERLGLSVKPPFTMFTMPSRASAEEALLELPFIHRAADTGNLISERLMTFGCYETTLNGVPTGEYEAMVTGTDLKLEEIELLEKAFEARGGKLKNHDKPAASEAPAQEKPAAQDAPAAAEGDISQVKFVELVKGNDGISTYEVYKAPDKASAMAFLKKRPVTQRLYYVVVDTPEGSFGRDIQGFYQE